MLNLVRYPGPLDQPPLIIAHGLFGSARNWGAVSKRLAEKRPVVAVDLRNHGDSFRDPDQSYEAMADDLAEVVAAEGGRADVLGHSMGGKAAMTLGLRQPARVGRLVVADIAPVAYSHSQLDYVQAMQAVDLSRVTRRSDADAALAAFIPEPAVRAFLLQSLVVGPEGPAWKLALETLAEQMPRIMSFPGIGGRFEGPTLFLTGGRSNYVRPEHWRVVEARFPAARQVVLPGVGHWLHAQAPGLFVEAINAFFAV